MRGLVKHSGNQKGTKIDVTQLLAWVAESHTSHRDWRAESWEDYEFRDGVQWPHSAKEMLKDKRIKPITANRIFPIVNFIHGWFINNQRDVIAKGRTKQDNDLAQFMSEALMCVRDQNNGAKKIADAVLDQIITGFGCMKVGVSPDPRKESVSLDYVPWHNVWWDPYSDPFMDEQNCRFVFTSSWKDLDTLCDFFPKCANDLQEQFSYLSGVGNGDLPIMHDDESTLIEEVQRMMGQPGYWTNSDRRRVRPVEMWYSVTEEVLFAKGKNGRAYELEAYNEVDQLAIIRESTEILTARVKKLRVSLFLGDYVIYDMPSPMPFTGYPYVPFVGYTDRFSRPFGAPRQIKEQNMELNKRRSYALARINDRRTFIEKKAVEDPHRTHAEANKLDGLIVVGEHKIDRVKIQELGDLASAQLAFAEHSEREIQEISGAGNESMGYQTAVQSGLALDKKQASQSTVLASLLENAYTAVQELGKKMSVLVQDNWTTEKALRVTDKMSGVEAFVALNQEVLGETGEVIEVRNDITQASFDIVLASTEMTDTMREKNMDLIFSSLNKAPAEAIGPLLSLGLELSDIPEKGSWLKQIQAATGAGAVDENLSKAEQGEIDRANAQKVQQRQEEGYVLEVQTAQAENQKTEAETGKLRAEAIALLKEADAQKQKVDQEGFKIGQESTEPLPDITPGIAKPLNKARMKGFIKKLTEDEVR